MPKNPSQLAVILGERVRELRTKQGWPQDELAHRADLHRTYIGAVERGERNVTLLTVERIAAALGVSPLDLLQ